MAIGLSGPILFFSSLLFSCHALLKSVVVVVYCNVVAVVVDDVVVAVVDCGAFLVLLFLLVLL